MKPVFALFIRALRQLNNSSSTLALRLFVGLILLLCLWGTHESTGWGGAPGKIYFTALVVVDYVLVTIIAAGIGAGAIASEKEEGSLGLLRLADLSPLSLLLGKCVGQLIGLLLLLAFQVPFTLLAVTLGGVAIRQVVEAYALLGTYVIALTCLGLFFSVVLAKVWRAFAMTLAASLAFTLLPARLESFADRLNPTQLRWDPQLQKVVNPSPLGLAEQGVDSSRIRAADQLRRAGDWIDSVSPWTHSRQLTAWYSGSIALSRSLIAQAAFGAFFFALARLLFERYCGDESKYGEMRKGRPIRQRLRLFRVPRPWGRAVAWRDFHFNFGGAPWFALRLIAYPLFAAIMISQISSPVTKTEIAATAGMLGVLVLYFDITFFVIRAWGTDVWDRTLSQLLLTPSSLPGLNFQKLLALVVAVIPSGLVLLTALIINLHGQSVVIGWHGALIYLSLVAQSLFFFSVCLNLSLRYRWGALIGAFFAWYIALMLIQGGLMLVTLPFLAKGRWMNTRSFEVMEAIQILAFLAAAVVVYLASQRQLLRHAEES